jgi:hypothetical protein
VDRHLLGRCRSIWASRRSSARSYADHRILKHRIYYHTLLSCALSGTRERRRRISRNTASRWTKRPRRLTIRSAPITPTACTADPLKRCRRVLLHAEPARHPRGRPRAARQSRTACASSSSAGPPSTATTKRWSTGSRRTIRRLPRSFHLSLTSLQISVHVHYRGSFR